jgi:hypothetical protein
MEGCRVRQAALLRVVIRVIKAVSTRISQKVYFLIGEKWVKMCDSRMTLCVVTSNKIAELVPTAVSDRHVARCRKATTVTKVQNRGRNSSASH